MKILHTEASCGWGGQEIRILEESRGLINKGHDVIILCPSESHILKEAPRFQVQAYALPIHNKNIYSLLLLYNWLTKNPVDIINSHSSTDSWLVSITCHFLKIKTPVIRTRHISSPIPHNPLSRWIYNIGASHIVTTGKKVRDQVIVETGVNPDRITSIPTGIDTGLFTLGDQKTVRKRLQLSYSQFIIGIIATLRSWKGHDDLFEALSLIKHQNPLLLVVGDGPQRKHLIGKARGLGLLDSHIIFVGQQEDVIPWFQALDICILPSYANEGVPQSLMQAMSCGIPVISTPVGSISEIIRENDTGLLVPPNSPKELSIAITKLLNNKELRNRLSSRARSFIINNHSIDKMLLQMIKVFDKVIKEHKRGME